MKLIPAIDLIDGQCVRLTKGDYSRKTIYSKDPLDVAKSFEEQGIHYLHVVDLDGARSEGLKNQKILERICTHTSLKVDFGGGIKRDEDLQMAFDCGAYKVTVGSIAVSDPERFERWLSTYGSERLILGADCMDRRIATQGWQEESDMDVSAFIGHYEAKGIKEVVCTDISKDGMLNGPAFGLYEEILQHHGIELIASGGISSIGDLERLRAIGCHGAIIGKALYEGRITLEELNTLC